MVRLLIVGGSDAAIAAGLQAREIDAQADVTVVVADAFSNYSICGLPFYLSGETPDWRQLAHRTADELRASGLELLLDHRATAIDATRHEVQVEDRAGGLRGLVYDRLIVATGAEPIRPDIPGLDLPGVFVLHTMDDSFRVHEALDAGGVREAVIVGSGYIGLEMAAALTHRGVHVTLIGRSESVMPTVDPTLGQLFADELRRRGIAVIVGAAVEAIERVGDRLAVHAEGGLRERADLVLVATGVRPNTSLAAKAGIDTGIKGAAEVAKRIDVYATALFHRTAVEGINDLDLSYTPPFGSPWDAVQLAAQAWERTRAGTGAS